MRQRAPRLREDPGTAQSQPPVDLASIWDGETRYRELVEHLHSGVVVYQAVDDGEDFVICDFNPAAARIEDVSAEAVIGRRVTEAFPGVREFGLLDVMRRVWKTGRSENHPISLYTDERLSSWRENHVYRLPSRLVVAVYDDVTERKRAEQAAAERAHFLEQLLEAIPAPVFYKDADLHYLGCNEAFATLVNLSQEEIVGKTVFDVYPQDIAERTTASDREALAHAGQQLVYELRVPGADATQLQVMTHKAAFSDVDGRPAGVIGVDLDVTETRRTEAAVAQGALQLQRMLKAAVTALGTTAEMRDPYTAGHQRRVAELACAIAAELGWSEGRIDILRTAALLHDIGKVVVPAEILAKPGRLSETELALIRGHAAAGAEVVADIDFEGAVADIIRQHHERLDGSGYPSGLRDGEILPEARILAIADVVEAMVSHRPYRAALSIEEALGEIEDGRGRRYDADTAAACARLFAEKHFAFSA